MTREEERNTIAHKIAWEYTKHYDPLLSKESWCEMAARDAIDWADQHPREGLCDVEKVCKWLNDRIGIDQKIETNSDGEPLADSYIAYCIARQNAADTMIKDLRKAMEN